MEDSSNIGDTSYFFSTLCKINLNAKMTDEFYGDGSIRSSFLLKMAHRVQEG